MMTTSPTRYLPHIAKLLLLSLIPGSSPHYHGYGVTSSLSINNASTKEGDMPIIGGTGDWRFRYVPDRMIPPSGASMADCHSFAVDAARSIYLTYRSGSSDDENCLIRWNADGTGGEFVRPDEGGADDLSALCGGIPHGMTIATEGGQEFLYHANNNQKLTKTDLRGNIVWRVEGRPAGHVGAYRPTWFAVPPNGKYAYLCDGYGSDDVFVFDRSTGEFENRTYGGKGGRSQHGRFETNHGCSYDLQRGKIAIADRLNSRIEFFDYDTDSPDHFVYSSTVDMIEKMGNDSFLPCVAHSYPQHNGVTVVPDLGGTVAILDNSDSVVSVLNVSKLLAKWHHDHPHDAVLLDNGDMVVATWNPGRLSYWQRLLPSEEISFS